MIRTLFALGASSLLMGCSAGEVKIGVDVAPIGTATSAIQVTGDSSTTTTTTTSSTAISLERVRLLVNEVKIGGRCMHEAGAESGPFVVDLTKTEIAGGAHRDFSLGSVAAGTYEEAEIEIEPYDADDPDHGDVSGTEFDDFRTSGASLIVDGTYDGKAFTFTGHFKAEQGTGKPVTVASGSTVTLPLTVDPEAWFKDVSGNSVDPTDTAQHASVAVAICETLDTEKDDGSDGDGPRAGARHHGGPGHGHHLAHCVEAAAK